MAKTYTLDEKAVDSKYVRFVTGNDKGRVAKICGMNTGGCDVIDVVIFLDGNNGWNFVHSHIESGDLVEIVDGPITLPIQGGAVPALPRTYDAVCRPEPLAAR